MNAPDPRAEALFDELLDLPPDARTARLRDRCGDDEVLRAEVESLLVAFEAAGDFLDEPLTGPLGDAFAPGSSPTHIGPYELVERIGSGGMGEVYLARREGDGYEQRVAVKIMRGTILADDVLQRFRNECRVLSRLDHPNIARMIDGGVDENGIPYLVMEYVEGRSIDRYADDERLDTRARVDLVRAVCAAVQHLHQHSTIHRDIKPANVLVKDDGQVKLIDFGIARVLDLAGEGQGELTVAGFERMTPQYASPEQLRGDVLTTATDVYSLGVLLYRLLTGALPYRGRQRRELEREITETSPARPSAVAEDFTSRSLRGDLDTIVLMAMRKEPERRYASVGHLDEDLHRYLRSDAVRARGDSLGYRAGKFARRNAIAVGASTLVVVLLIAASVTGFALYTRAERARADAERERGTAVAVGDFLQSLLAAADPSTADARPDMTVREALDRAAGRIERELAHRPRVATELRLTLARAYHNLGALDVALETLVAARASAPPHEEHLRARISTAEAEVRIVLEDYATAESLLVDALREPARLSTESMGTAHLARTRLYNVWGRYDEARAAGRRAVDAAQELPPGAILRTQAINALAEATMRTGAFAAAESLMHRALAVAREDLGPDHVLTATSAQNLGHLLVTKGTPAEAIGWIEEALRILRANYGDEHVEVAIALTNLGDALQAVGRYDEALEIYGRARGAVEATLGPTSSRYGTLSNNVAQAYLDLDRLDEAAVGFEEAANVYGHALGDGHPWQAIALNNLARVEVLRGHHDAARSLAERVATIFADALPDGHHLHARPRAVLASVELATGRAAVALEMSTQVLALVADLPPTNRTAIEAVLLNARCRFANGDPRGARAVLRDHLARLEADDTARARLESALADL